MCRAMSATAGLSRGVPSGSSTTGRSPGPAAANASNCAASGAASTSSQRYGTTLRPKNSFTTWEAAEYGWPMTVTAEEAGWKSACQSSKRSVSTG